MFTSSTRTRSASELQHEDEQNDRLHFSHEKWQNCILAFAPCNATRAALQGSEPILSSEEAPTFRSDKAKTFHFGKLLESEMRLLRDTNR